MDQKTQLVIYENPSIPRSYEALETLSAQGLEPLEFFPHANGVRILFRKPEGWNQVLPTEAKNLQVSKKVLKALLSQSGNVLKEHLLVVETKSLSALVELANKFEELDAEVLEIRSLRSNPEKNYALITLAKKEDGAKFLSGVDHSFLSSTSAVLKDFLGFN